MVKTMKTNIIGLLFISSVMAANSFAAGLDVRIDEKSLKIGAAVKAIAVIKNDQAEAVEWLFESYLRSTNPKAPTPRGISQKISLQPGEEKSIEISFSTEGLVYSGEYNLVSYVVGKENKSIATSEHTITVSGGLKQMDVKPILCADKECRKLSKVFTQGQTVYINFKSDVENPQVVATITLPDKKQVQDKLPTELPVKQTGDYVIKSVATKEGYKTDNDTVMFAVVSPAKDEIDNMLKMQED